jgi:hypothetical protein
MTIRNNVEFGLIHSIQSRLVMIEHYGFRNGFKNRIMTSCFMHDLINVFMTSGISLQ